MFFSNLRLLSKSFSRGNKYYNNKRLGERKITYSESDFFQEFGVSYERIRALSAFEQDCKALEILDEASTYIENLSLYERRAVFYELNEDVFDQYVFSLLVAIFGGRCKLRIFEKKIKLNYRYLVQASPMGATVDFLALDLKKESYLLIGRDIPAAGGLCRAAIKTSFYLDAFARQRKLSRTYGIATSLYEWCFLRYNPLTHTVEFSDVLKLVKSDNSFDRDILRTIIARIRGLNQIGLTEGVDPADMFPAKEYSK